MADLLIGKTNVTKLLSEKYKKLGTGWLTLVEIPAEKHMDINAEAIKILTQDLKYSCVYITLSKSVKDLEVIFKKKGIAIDNIYYIDAISKMYGDMGPNTKKIIYTSGPLDIDALTVSVREMLSKIQAEKKCVFLDSVTTVLLYNSMPRTLRFSKFLTKTLKQSGVDGVMVSLAKGATTKGLTEELKRLSDEFIVIK
jgi:KaiC/GvpD/RAD55 family RecA-like ATPase